jgi:Holliday junction resolvase
MSKYSKGSNAERELIKKAFSLGFAAARTAGSGSTPLPAPDLVILGKNLKLGIESKAWTAEYLHLDLKQMNELIEWGKKAEAIVYIGWKKNREGWQFLLPEQFNKREKNYIISWNKAKQIGVSFEVVLGLQKQLK